MLNAWFWLVGGLIICFAEMMLPGAFLLWVGLASMLTGSILLLLAEGTLTDAGVLVLFAILAVLCSAVGRVVYGSWQKTVKPEFLGRRAEGLIGQTFLLDAAIINGEGRIKVQDSVWNVRGPDLPVGEKVKVTSVENGVNLRVEQA